MHARSRTVTKLIQEAHTEASTLQGELEAAQTALSDATERVKAAQSSHENLDELLAVAENARLVCACSQYIHVHFTSAMLPSLLCVHECPFSPGTFGIGNNSRSERQYLLMATLQCTGAWSPTTWPSSMECCIYAFLSHQSGSAV